VSFLARDSPKSGSLTLDLNDEVKKFCGSWARAPVPEGRPRQVNAIPLPLMAGQQYVLLEGHLVVDHVVDMRKTLTEEKDASRTATQGGTG